MYCLSCVSITKPLALASLPTNNDSHPIQTKHTKLPMHTTEPKTTLPLPLPLPRKKKQQHKRQQPTIAQIERAIGAGRYRDIDARHVQFHLFLHNLNICFGVLLLTCGSEFWGLFQGFGRGRHVWIRLGFDEFWWQVWRACGEEAPWDRRAAKYLDRNRVSSLW